jgi:transposase
MKRNEGIHWYDISDEAWERIKDLLPGQAGKHGGAAKDNRLFINVADAHGRTVRHAARIREPEQHA